jgi:hypothetical protein
LPLIALIKTEAEKEEWGPFSSSASALIAEILGRQNLVAHGKTQGPSDLPALVRE